VIELCETYITTLVGVQAVGQEARRIDLALAVGQREGARHIVIEGHAVGLDALLEQFEQLRDF